MTDEPAKPADQRGSDTSVQIAGDIKADRAGIAAGAIYGGVHQENFNGLVIKEFEGTLIYQAVVDESVTFDAAQVESEYLERVTSSELATIDTMLGRVPLDRLTVPSYLLPITPGRDLDQDAGAAISRESAVRAVDALEIAPRLVVVAGPGMGKTTFLNAIATTLAVRRTGDIPVPLSLYRYVTESEGRPIIDFVLRARFGEMYKGKELEAFGDVLRLWNRDGKLLFLLDGLDEVPEDRRRALVDQFAGLTRFVLTTRPIGRVDAYQPQGGTLQLLPLADRDVTRFIYQWARLDGVGPAFEPRAILRTVRRDDRLADLARVPQLLGLVCYLWSGGTIQGFRTRADLFARTTDAMIVKGLDQLEVGGDERETLPRSLRRWLRKLAMDMLAHPSGSRLRISHDVILDDLEIGRSESDAARLFRLARASGLIVRALDGLDDFQFVHLVFQEYLAAEALAASDDPTSLITRLLHRTAFEEPLRMACAIWADRGDDERLATVLQDLIEADAADRFGMNLLLAGRCLGEIDNVEQRLPDIVAAVEEGLLDHASQWYLRARFAPVMAQLKTTGMRHRLVEALESDQFHTRWAAAVALGQMGDPATLKPVLDRLDVEGSTVISAALIDAVAGIGSADAVPFLMNVLEWLANQPDPDVFMATASGAALARLGATEELAMLATHMDSQPVADAMLEALRYLPAAQASVLVDAFNAGGTTVRFSTAEEVDPGPSLEDVEAAAKSGDPEDRIGAVRDFGRIGNVDARWALLELVTDNEPTVAEAAANELENAWNEGWGLLASIDELAGLMLLSRPSDYSIVIHALWAIPRTRQAMAQIWDEKVRAPDERAAAIALLAASDDEHVRGATAVILGVFRAKDHIAELTGLLDSDPSSDVRRPAIWALGRLADPAALSSLLREREVPDEELEELADALGAIGSPEAIHRLVELAGHNADGVRRHAVASLGIADDERAVTALLGALDDNDGAVRLAAIRSLGVSADPRIITPLVDRIGDADPDVRAAVATGLRSARGDVVDAALGRLAEDEMPDVVYAALDSLGQSGRGDIAAAALTALLDHEIETVRIQACAEIAYAGSAADAAKLKSMLRADPSKDVQSAAADAFGRLASTNEIIELIDELDGPLGFSSLDAVSSHLTGQPESELDDIAARLAAHDVQLRARPDRTTLIMRTPTGDTKLRLGGIESNVPEGEDPTSFYVGQLDLPDAAMRWDAADALGRIQDIQTIGTLVGALLDADPIVAHEAARAIEGMTRDEGLHDGATMALAAATADARRAGTLPDLIHLLVEERSSGVTSVVRDLLSVPEAMCELLTDGSGDEDVLASLWTIAERYNVRFMPDARVIMPSGERLSCDVARQRLGVA